MKKEFCKEIAWSKQLLREYENILYAHDVHLEKPTFRISEAKRQEGSWEPHSRTISISRHFIEKYPWYLTIELLKHEMAHQYVSEILKENTAHGASFKKACQKLGVHPEFYKANGDISSSIILKLTKELSPEAEKMLNKVEKLLALGMSDNEHEALSASKKAKELILKHNLEIFSKNNYREDTRATYLVITQKKKRIESLQKCILGILRDFYFVNPVTFRLYDPQDDDSYRSIVLFGIQENLEVAKYVYHYLRDTGTRLWKEYKERRKVTMRHKVSFDMGFIKGVRANLQKSLPKSKITEVVYTPDNLPVAIFETLSLQLRKQNENEMHRVFPKLRSDSYGAHYKGHAYKEGFSKGERTFIRKGIHKKSSGITGLLSE